MKSLFKNFVRYSPLIKTTAAELKAYQNLLPSIKKTILPIVELTRSRISKNNRTGALNKQIEKMLDLFADTPFIIDLTTHIKLDNQEIEKMLHNTENGFSQWRLFIDRLRREGLSNVIPVIHFNDDASPEDFILQIKEIEKSFIYAAFRFDVFDELAKKDYLSVLMANFKNKKNLFLILDAGFIPVLKWKESIDPIKRRINEILELSKECNLISMSSCFPSSVISNGYGGKNGKTEGGFELSEVLLYEEILKGHENIIYGDYAGIHPVRYDVSGGAWVPRVDVPSYKEYFYYRCPRDEGGYVIAAEKVVNDKRYKRLPLDISWGDDEIESAARGVPNGKSPSHWISVRSNMHMCQQYLRMQSKL